jgi:hypothetical protein
LGAALVAGAAELAAGAALVAAFAAHEASPALWSLFAPQWPSAGLSPAAFTSFALTGASAGFGASPPQAWMAAVAPRTVSAEAMVAKERLGRI